MKTDKTEWYWKNDNAKREKDYPPPAPMRNASPSIEYWRLFQHRELNGYRPVFAI